jgi:hypothetical protein
VSTRVVSGTSWLWIAVIAGVGCQRGKDLSVAQLSEVVVREQPTLEACYQASLDRAPYDHEFRIQAKLAIRRDGTVEKVELDQTGTQGLGPCLEKTIRGWRFPKAEADTLTSLPIVFRPKVEKVLPDNLQLPPGFQVLQDDKRP